MQLTPKAGSALAGLTAAALALPGIAATPAAQTELQYQFNRYQEADNPADRTFGGAASPRFEIGSHQLRLLRPRSEDREWRADLTYETLSGATPWFVTEQNGRPVQVLSGPTIEERRFDLVAQHRWYGEGGYTGLSGGTSIENDYRSVSLGAEQLRETSDRRLAVSYGVGASFDRLEPTDGGPDGRFPGRVASASKQSQSVYVSLSDVLNPRTLVQYGLSLNRASGFLSDPYKLAEVAGEAVADARPDERFSAVATLRLRHYLPNPGAALHLDYRYFRDDWRVDSHTVELGWLQTLAAAWTAELGGRYYSQSQAFFYQPFFRQAREDGLASSDYRLSPYGAVALRAGLGWRGAAWQARLNVESYRADAGLALGRVRVAHPGLVEFTTVSLALGYRY